MSKTTVVAPANIAFVKYWGARDSERVIPFNRSISMTLERCHSVCTAEVISEERDQVWLAETDGGFRAPEPEFDRRVREHLDTMRRWAGREDRLWVATRNSFPSAGGLASSASGFAALTLAAAGALGKGNTSTEELSRLARLSGSGSAARSVLGGYVEWPAIGVDLEGPDADRQGHAVQIADAEHWDLKDVIAVVELGPKVVSSLEGHRRATTSPYFAKRQELLPDRLRRVLEAIEEQDLDTLGPILEEEAIDLHLIAMSSRPPIFYWSPGTVAVLKAVSELRQEGLSAWATLDAGANVHVICDPDSEQDVVDRLENLPAVGFLIRDGVGGGPETDDEHLF
jgi:diphosphomevalonate decarboxylase